MLADFFTKPLQGSLFRKFRDVMLGYSHLSTLRVPELQLPEERVDVHLQSERNPGSENSVLTPTTSRQQKHVAQKHVAFSTSVIKPASKLILAGK